MPPRARMGVLFFTSGWFRDVGIQDESAGSMTGDIERMAGEIIRTLEDRVDPVYRGVIFTQEEARRAGEDIRKAGVDGVLLAPLMWCEDQIVRAALKQLPRLPVIVCTLFPHAALQPSVSFNEMIKGTGSVGTLQLSGMLKREGWTYFPVTGHYRDASVYEEIGRYSAALAIKRALTRARVGVLPFRCEQMSTTYVDEFALRTLYGVELSYLEIVRLQREAQEVRDEEVSAFIRRIEAMGHAVEVDPVNLAEGVRYAIALQRIMKKEKLDILVMNDVIDEMHQCLGLRPCLSNPDLSATGAVVAMEADVGAGLAMYILRLLTEESPFYTEALTADMEHNHLLMGHAGFHDAANRDPGFPVSIIPDVEYRNTDRFTGCCTYFKYKPGPVTVVNSVYDGRRLSWTAVEGTSVEGPPVLEGNCHLLFKPDIPVRDFYRRAILSGVSQHFLVVHGRHLDRLRALCEILGIGFTPLRAESPGS